MNVYVRAIRPAFRCPSQIPAQPAFRSFSTHHPTYSGHNKWSKIKDKKAAQDAQRSVLYAKMNQEISVAVRQGGSTDPSKNSFLAAVLRDAKERDVPKENIERSLARCEKAGNRKGERFIYEALAVGNSVGIIIECMTDNVNRTIHGVKEILTANSARMAPVKFMFGRQGCVTVSLAKDGNSAEALMDLAFVNGLTDFGTEPNLCTDEREGFWLFCKPEDIGKFELTVREHAPKLGVEVISAEIVYLATEPVHVEEDVKEKVQDLVQQLEANDDTVRVWTSLDFAR